MGAPLVPFLSCRHLNNIARPPPPPDPETLMDFRHHALSAAALSLLLSACGGGSSGSTDTSAPPPTSTTPPPAAPTTVSGTAATGAPIQGTVVAIDVNGKTSPVATTNTTTGAYTVDVTGLTAPFLLTVAGSSGGRQVTLTSVATAAGQTVNLTPLTDLIVATAAGVTAGSSLVDACTPSGGAVATACLDALKAATAGTKLKDAAQQVATMIAPLNSAGTDPLNGSFKADGTGLDGVLDRLLVAPNASGQATVTLVATQAVIGQAGSAGALTVTPPTTAQATSADAVAKVLPEINACLASLAAFYPSTGFKAPTSAQVEPFIDPNFNSFGMTKADIVALLTSGQAPAAAGFAPKAVGLAHRDLAVLTSSEITVLTDPTVTNKVRTILDARVQGGAPVKLDDTGKPVSAWVRLQIEDVEAQQFVKGAAYSGCDGGWRWAGANRLDMHMAARVARDETKSTLQRERAFHLEREAVAAAVTAGMPDADAVDVRGPGLVAYSGNAAAPVGDSTKLTLLRSPNSFINSYVIGGAGAAFYGDSEAVLSCPDLATRTNPAAAAGTPCIDESQVQPGSIYIWALKQTGTGKIVRAFPYEVNAVPLSKVFAQANASNLFATISAIAPASVAATNTAIAGATGNVLDGVFSISYTLGSAYGARPDNCNVGLFDAQGNYILRAEANAVGQTTKCTFTTDGLNSGSLTKPAGQAASGYVSVATSVLGNQVTTTRALP